MELDWPLPNNKQSPLYICYNPQATNLSENFVNPFLGYPTSPIIGRYNRGQYRIGQTLFQLQFKCLYNEKDQRYYCGATPLNLPHRMVQNLRNIPEVIVNNKAAGIKNSPEVLPQRYPIRPELSFYWVVSFGQLGKDFLNYLNHMYVLAAYLFVEQKLKRNVHYLPIYAHLPQNSGLNDFEVERGLNFNTYRGEYMSFHLSKGAPAFSPNNMRLSVLGGKIITTKQFQRKPQEAKKPKNKRKKADKGKVEVQKKRQDETEQKPLVENIDKSINQQKMQIQQKQEKVVEKQNNKMKEEEFQLDWNEIEANIAAEVQLEGEKKTQQPFKQEKPYHKKKENQELHQGFIHFYTSALLEEDYRIYYHWHIEDNLKEGIIKQIWKQSRHLEEFIEKYQNFVGKEPMGNEIKKLLFGHYE